MKKTVLILTAFAALFVSRSEGLADEEKSLRERVHEWAKVFEKNRPELMVKFYEDTENLDMLVSSGKWNRGIKEIRTAYEKDGELITYSDSEVINLNTRVVDGIGLASFEHRFILLWKKEDVKLRLHIRTTMTMRKIDGEWKIIAEHSSGLEGVERIVEIE